MNVQCNIEAGTEMIQYYSSSSNVKLQLEIHQARITSEHIDLSTFSPIDLRMHKIRYKTLKYSQKRVIRFSFNQCHNYKKHSRTVAPHQQP
jgi:hypothetical protein